MQIASHEPSRQTLFSLEEADFMNIIGDLVEQWGFNRQTGRIWALLYLSPHPLTAKQIQTTLKISAGAANSLLIELLTWGAIKRLHREGDRNGYFDTQNPVWKPLANVLKTRELRILAEAQEGLKQLTHRLKKKSHSTANTAQLKKLEHITALLDTTARIGEMLVNAPLDRLEKVISFIRRLRGY